MKSREDLVALKKLYEKRMGDAHKFIDKFRGTAGETEWHIQFHMARGKVEVLNFILYEENEK